MLLVFPPGMKHDTFAPTTAYEDHLLERVSLLEMRLMQLSDSLALTLDVINNQSQIMSDEHNLVRELYESVKKISSPTVEQILPKWEAAFKKHDLGSSPRIAEILAANDIKNHEMLELLVREAFEHIEQKDEQKTFATLKRAELIAQKNVPLLLLFAEQLFYADKFDESKQKLEKAVKFAPNDQRISLLLGAIYADGYEIEKAEKILDFSAKDEKIHCAVKMITGMTAVFRGDLKLSVDLFKASLERFQFPDIFYLLACVYFQRKKYKQSIKYFQKTVEFDGKFTDAYFLMSLAYGISDRREEADAAAKSALKNIENSAQCMEFVGAKKAPDLKTALPFLHFKNKKPLLSGGSQRNRKFVRTLIFYILNG